MVLRLMKPYHARPITWHRNMASMYPAKTELLPLGVNHPNHPLGNLGTCQALGKPERHTREMTFKTIFYQQMITCTLCIFISHQHILGVCQDPGSQWVNDLFIFMPPRIIHWFSEI